jgi:signal transduction histidine kinase
MITQRRPGLVLLGQVAALVAMGAFGLLDIESGLFDGPYGEFTGLLRVLQALLTAAVWLPKYRHGSRLLPILAGAVAGWSLLLTGMIIVVTTGDGGGSWGIAEAAGLMLILLVLARRGAAAPAAVAGAVVLLALVAEPLRSGDDAEVLALGLLQALFGVAAAVAGGYPRYTADTRDRQLAVARAEQRAEFARDLHDFVAHHVTGIVVQAQGARYVAEQDPKRVMAALEQIEHAGVEAMTAMRRMVAMLRSDAPLAPLADITELQTLTDGFTAAGGPPVRLAVDGALEHLPLEITTSAYRVVMEALTNVRQHATGVTEVVVQVQRTPDWLLVRVADDGTPGGSGTPGFGLLGLTERVHAVGGWLHAGPNVGRGWLVDARLPLGEPR